MAVDPEYRNSPLSKRLRFEVLTRDGYTCRYCGARAPDVRITVDHVIPRALGGKNDPSNLVAACEDCNGGKSSQTPDAATVAEVMENAERFARALILADQQIAERQAARANFVESFRVEWDRYPKEFDTRLPSTWRGSLERIHSAGLAQESMLPFVDLSMRCARNNVFRYFCGCCWRSIHDRIELAASLME